MNTKELQRFTANWIKKKRELNRKTQKQFSSERGINSKTLNKHEGTGVLRFDLLVKYIDSDEDMILIFRKFKT